MSFTAPGNYLQTAGAVNPLPSFMKAFFVAVFTILDANTGPSS